MNVKKTRKAIKYLNKIKFFGLRRYKMGTALGVAISDGFSNLNWSKSLKSLLFGCIMHDFDLKISGKGRLVFLFSPNYMDRKLCKDDFLAIAELMSDTKVVIASRHPAKLDFRKIPYVIFYPIWLLQMISAPLSIKQKLNLIGRMASCKKWISVMPHKIISNSISLLTTFFDANMYDNISAQYCRHKSIPTATLQHGLYFKSTRSIFEQAFELFVSDKMLVWGKDTEKKAIKSGLDAKRIYIAGMVKSLERLSPKSDAAVFGVLLAGRHQYTEQINLQLVTLANELAARTGLKYVIRDHPTQAFPCRHLYKNEFLSFICHPDTPIHDMASKVQFFICTSISGLQYELLHAGAFVFVHKNSYENHFESDMKKLSFKNVEQLIGLIDWTNENHDEYQKVADRISMDLFAINTLDNYRLFFEEYLK